MRYRLVSLALTAVAAAQSYNVAAQESGGVARLAWLTGCWAQQAGQTMIEEHWTAPRGGMMLSVGRTTRSGKVVEYEFIAVREQDSRLAYEAHPSGQPAATFLSIQIGDDAVVFENATHDFPQRVGYRKAGADSLDAWIEGEPRGQQRHIDFKYRRQSCTEP